MCRKSLFLFKSILISSIDLSIDTFPNIFEEINLLLFFDPPKVAPPKPNSFVSVHRLFKISFVHSSVLELPPMSDVKLLPFFNVSITDSLTSLAALSSPR
ncbi:MAG: hypothetical protein CM15mP129_09230 [Chloroflexota bacterium]|nr:MAG: hypothetical protein CM15mP129_09230 [Chloroflexota bacterium]